MDKIKFQKAILCILEANQLSSKIADEILKYREGQPHSFGGLSDGFKRIASRLEALAKETPAE